ncbi:hypothetical protein BRADI_1g62075v3 [Brachypodium distachyon]|uniref:Uncharacterized protein n=1 Tax=Brachypodium distachyon TaxID=15368 RepID=A0A2K2DT09_BRADI|nr:hypothetical protein BRADI_1g62075v3 [Brachypodium distachyon]
MHMQHQIIGEGERKRHDSPPRGVDRKDFVC